MTVEEKQKMMNEIMQVVEKHVASSESASQKNKEKLKAVNKYGREYGISDEEMANWKEEYRKMRVDTKAVLEEVRKNPIDTSSLISSFDLGVATSMLK